MAESVGLGALLTVDLECESLGLIVVLRPVVVGPGYHCGLQTSVMVRSHSVMITLTTNTVLHPLDGSVSVTNARLLRSWTIYYLSVVPVAVLYSPVSTRPLF